MTRRGVWLHLVCGSALSVAVASCAGPGQRSPLAPDTAAPFSESSLAAATSETSHEVPADEVFTDTNPCTGESVEVTFHYLQYVAHSTEDGKGGVHAETSGVLEVTTDDGFSGRGQVRARNSWSAGDVSQEGFGLSVTLGNGTGQRVVVHIVGHLVIVDGVPTVELEIESLECQGKPVA
jgi:hypothetical protein